jgi:putative ABC transport system permease protein
VVQRGWRNRLEFEMNNLRYAFRLLRRAPGFTSAALLALALATGANTAVFSLVYSVLLRPLPFPEPSRLVSITQFFPSFNQSAVTGPAYLDWRDGIGRTARIAAYSQADYTLAHANLTEPIPAAMVSHEFFEVLGVHPIAGRTFSAADDSPGNDAVAVISEGFWNEGLGRDPGFAGSRIALDGRSYQIIGVMPASCAFPPAARVWLPLALDPVRERQGGPMNLVRVIGRLTAGTTETALTSTLSAISLRSAQGFGAGSRVGSTAVALVAHR